MLSENCLTCSQRHLLCDGARPRCQRCLDARRKCRGYDRDLKIVFYNSNGRRGGKATGGQKHQNKEQSHEIHLDDASLSLAGQSKLSFSSPRGRTTAIAYSEETSIIDTCIPYSLVTVKETDLRPLCLFISAFVPKAKYGTMLEFVPDLYKVSTPNSCFKQSLQAVSVLNFMNRYKAYHLMQGDVRDAYYKAIVSTNAALGDKSLTLQDETLASVWLLSLYELLASGAHTFGEKTPWINHVHGTLALLRLRGKSRATTKVGRQLFTLVYVPIIVMFMMGGQAPPGDITFEYQETLKADGACPGALVDMVSYIQQVADWRARMKQACDHLCSQNPADDSSRMTALLVEGVQLINLDTSGESNCQQDPDISLEFTSVTDMSYELTVWTSNLLAIQTLLQALFLCQDLAIEGPGIRSGYTEERLLGSILEDTGCFHERLSDLADKILGSVQYAFGDYVEGLRSEIDQRYSINVYKDIAVGAYHMFWPLGALIASPFVTESRKVAARAALKVVGERFCIIQALRYI